MEGDGRRRATATRIGLSDQRFFTKRHREATSSQLMTDLGRPQAGDRRRAPAAAPEVPGRRALPRGHRAVLHAAPGPVLVPAHLRDAGLDGAVQHEPEHARLRRPDDPGADPVPSPRQDLLGRQRRLRASTRATRSSTRVAAVLARGPHGEQRGGVRVRGRDLRAPTATALRPAGSPRRTRSIQDSPDALAAALDGPVRRGRRPVRVPCAPR